MKHIPHLRYALFSIFCGLAAVALFTLPNHARAAFDPNRIIRDEDLTNSGTMSVAQIQSFLQANNSCLASVDPAELGKRDGQVKVANTKSAAQVIYDAANGMRYDGVVNAANKMNPQILLVTLQKEYSLITQSCNTLKNLYGVNYLTKAVGYNVPNTLPLQDPDCLNTFYNQLMGNYCVGTTSDDTGSYLGAAQAYRRNFDLNKVGPGGAYPFPQSFTVQTKSWEAGNTTVTPATKATALLYRYTPYVYNGNYNFSNLFNQWFGSAPMAIVTNDVDTHGNIVGVDTSVVMDFQYLGFSDNPLVPAIIARRKDANGNFSEPYDFGTASENVMTYGNVRRIAFKRALPVGEYQIYGAVLFRGEWQPVTNLTRTINIRMANITSWTDARDYYKSGTNSTIAVTFKNNEGFRVYTSGFGLAARIDGRVVDYPAQGASYLESGEQRTVYFNKTFDDGTVEIFPIYKLDTADWIRTLVGTQSFGSWADNFYLLRFDNIRTDQNPVYWNDPTDYNVAISNPTANDITVGKIRMAGRRFNAGNFDFSMVEGLRIPAGGSVNVRMRGVTGMSGDFQMWPIYLSGNGRDWVAFKPLPGVPIPQQIRVY